MRIGNRIAHTTNGGVGHVEQIDGDWIDVRWLTPNNEPSCMVSVCRAESLVLVGENVIPQPRSVEWWEESRAFCGAIRAALEHELQGVDE